MAVDSLMPHPSYGRIRRSGATITRCALRQGSSEPVAWCETLSSFRGFAGRGTSDCVGPTTSSSRTTIPRSTDTPSCSAFFRSSYATAQMFGCCPLVARSGTKSSPSGNIFRQRRLRASTSARGTYEPVGAGSAAHETIACRSARPAVPPLRHRPPTMSSSAWLFSATATSAHSRRHLAGIGSPFLRSSPRQRTWRVASRSVATWSLSTATSDLVTSK